MAKGRPRRRSFKSKRKYGLTRRKRVSLLARRRSVTLGSNPIPTRIIATLPYVETVTLGPTAGIVSSYAFNLLSCYDPNSSGTGHQPYTFDQRMLMHDHYTVLGAKITVKFITGGVTPYACGIRICDDTSGSPTDYKLAMELPRTTYRIVGAGAANGERTATITRKFSTKRYFGVKDVLDGGKYSGTAASNPSDSAFAMIWAGSHDGTTATGNIQATVRINFIVAFTEPKDSLGLS